MGALVLGAVVSPAVAEQTVRDLYLTGRYGEALEAFARASPASPDEELLRADCSGAVGDSASARDDLRGAMRRYPDSALLPASLARLESDCGNLAEAAALVEAALKLDEKCVAARWVQAELLRQRGKLQEAQAAYQWLVDHFQSGTSFDRSEDRHLVGLAAAQLARWTRNHQQFKWLIADFYPDIVLRDPKYWPAHLEMARLFAEKYNEADATAAIHAGLAINPRAADLHALRAQMAVDKFDLSTARAGVEAALAVDASHLGALRIKADLLLADVRPAEAVNLLQDALKRNPHDEETLGRLAAVYAAVDGLPGGSPSPRLQKLLDQVQEANPHGGVFHQAAGDALDRMRRYPQAAEQYRQALERMPQLSAARGKLGMTLMRLGEEIEAAQVLGEAFAIDPFHVRVKNTLEVLDLLQGYAVLETDHFVLKFDRGQSELLARYATRYLEREIYPQLVEQLGYRPEGKTLIEIFSRHRSTSGHGWFSARMVGLPAIGTVGACAGRMIALTSPDELEKKFNWARVLRHEYVHVLNLQQTDFGVPHWLTEGLAVRYEGGPRPRAWDQVLAQRVAENRLFTLDTLTMGFVRPANSDDWSLAYCQAALHADFLHDQFGPRAHRALLDAYAQRMTTAAAIEKALQVSQADYERSYREYLARYLATQGLQVAPPPVSLAAQEENADAATKAALAKAYLDRQNFSLARRWADAAREESASLPVAAYVLARLKLSIGETEAALELLRDSLDENQPQEDALALLAALTLQAEDFGAALRLYELGQKHFPASDRWLRGMARIHLQQSDDERLAAVLERLAALEPDSIPIRKKLAALALAHQRPESARRWATELIHLDLSDPLPHAQLAQAARQLADLDLAAEEYETATVLDPQQLVWRIAWAEVLLELGQPDRAREVVESVRGRAVEQPGLKALLEKLKRE